MHEDTGSGDNSRDSGQGDDDSGRQNDDTSREDDTRSSDTEDDGLKKFAKSQGFDPDNLTEGEKRALKLAHDNQKAFRQRSQAESSKLKDTVVDAATDDSDFDGLDEDEAERIRDRNERAEDRAERRTTRFYLQNPEAIDYDTDMAEIVQEELEKNGREAATWLASDLNRLLDLAKVRRGNSDRKSEVEAARREERESFRQKQEAGSSAPAAQSNAPRTNKVTREWIDNEYDPGNAEHRQMVDEAIARGDLY